jgi:hypothetical protein
LWSADDYNHRLHPDKLRDIIQLSESVFEIGDLEIEVEYQVDNIAKFGLDYDGVSLLLSSKKTDCLAKENDGIVSKKTLYYEIRNLERRELILNDLTHKYKIFSEETDNNYKLTTFGDEFISFKHFRNQQKQKKELAGKGQSIFKILLKKSKLNRALKTVAEQKYSL